VHFSALLNFADLLYKSFLFQDTKPPFQDVLESRFLADRQRACCFETGQYQYKLNFLTMTQKNIKIGTKREVRRRPYFISELDVKTGGLYVLLLLIFCGSLCLKCSCLENNRYEYLTHLLEHYNKAILVIMFYMVHIISHVT